MWVGIAKEKLEENCSARVLARISPLFLSVYAAVLNAKLGGIGV